MPPPPPILLGTLLLSGLIILSAALGRRLFRLLRFRIKSAPERALLATGLGLGTLQFLPFVLLACRAGHSPGIKIGALVLALLLLPDVLVVLRRARRLPRVIVSAWKSAPTWQRLTGCIFAALLFAVYLRALCPITDDDGLSYHFSAALRLLGAGRFIYLPTLTYANWPSGVESLFILLRGLHSDAPVGIVQFTFGALTLAAAWILGRRIGGGSLAWSAATMLLVYKVFWEEMTQAHVDLGAALFATLSILSLHVAIQNPKSKIQNLSALFAGLGATCKLNGVWIIAAMALVVAFAPTEEGQPLPARIRGAAFYFATGIAVVLPWFARSWFVTGNPLYPMFFGLFGGREWTAEGWPRIQQYFLLMNTPPGLPPTRANLLMGRAVLVGLAAFIALFAYRRTVRSKVALPARFGFGFVPLLFLSSGYNMRFLLPAFPCIIFCAAYGLHGLAFGSIKLSRRVRFGPAAVCVLAAILSLRIGINGLNPNLPVALSVALGGTSTAGYLRNTLPDYSVVEFANANLPPGARILVGTWEEGTAYYRNLAMRSNYWLQDSVHYDSAERLDSDLARLGVTHLVFKPMDSEWCLKSSVCYGRMKHEARGLEDLIVRRGEKLFEANNVTLYRLHQ